MESLGQESAPESAFEAAYRECVERIDAGDDSGTVLESMRQRYAGIWEALRAAISSERAVARIVPRLRPGPGDRAVPLLPSPFGNYELGTLLGEGGMGIVLEAREISLDRPVAIKLIRDQALAGPAEIGRFKNEARTLARLKHPHIVDIFEVGEVGTRLYYSMEKLEGGSLSTRLRESKPAPAEAARIAAAVADAMSHAHGQGVIHRDLKPGNILFDRRGEVKVSDFGLSKTAQGGAALTSTNVILGTEGYMSPEQAGGSSVGPGTDVYSLGAVLYEMLTGRPPPVVVDPIRPRRFDPGIPRDIETIALKCLEHRPERRYRSAGELHDDLQAFQDGRPIKARRASVLDRLGKAARRRPAVASLAVLVLVVAAVAFAWILRSNRLLNREKNLATEQTERARVLSMHIQEVLEGFVSTLSRDPRLLVRDLEDFRREQLEAAVGRYRAIAEIIGDDPVFQVQRGRALGLMAQVLDGIGRKADALSAFDQAAAAFSSVLRSDPGHPDAGRFLGTACSDRSTIQSQLGRPDLADVGFRDAIEFHRRNVGRSDAAPVDRRSLAMTLGNLAHHLERNGRPEEAVISVGEARTILEDLFRNARADARAAIFARDLALAKAHAGRLLFQVGEVDEALDLMRQSLAHQERQLQESPDDETFKVHLADTLNNLALSVSDVGDLEKARGYYQRSIELGRELVASHPRVVEHRAKLAVVIKNQGTLLADLGQPDLAEDAFKRARDEQRSLVKEESLNPSHVHELAGTIENLARLYDDLGWVGEAETCHEEARRLRKDLADRGVQTAELDLAQALALNNSAISLQDAGRMDEAEAAILEATGILRPLVERYRQFPRYGVELSKVRNTAGILAQDRGDRMGSMANFKCVLDLRKGVAESHPRIIEFQDLHAEAFNNLGTVFHAERNHGQAEPAYLDAIRIRITIRERCPSLVENARALIKCRSNLGLLQSDVKVDHESAVATLTEALNDATALGTIDVAIPKDRHARARILGTLGTTFQRMGRLDEAVGAYTESIEIGESLLRAHPWCFSYADSLSLQLGNLGEVFSLRNEAEAAMDRLGRSIDVVAPFMKTSPRHPGAGTALVRAHHKRGTYLTILGRLEEATADWDAVCRVARDSEIRGTIALCAAGSLARASADVGTVAGMDPCDLKARAEAYGLQAVRLLETARREGRLQDESGIMDLETDSRFASLRCRADFQELLARIRETPTQD